MVKVFSIFIMFYSIGTHAQSRVSFGSRNSAMNTKLKNINKDYSGIGHSVPDYTQSDIHDLRGALFLRFTIYKGFGLDIEVEKNCYNSKFNFKYYNTNFNIMVDRQLNINLKYLSIPILATFTTKISSHSSLLFKGGVILKRLQRDNDNFQDILIEKVAFAPGVSRFEKYVMAVGAGLEYAYSFKCKHSIIFGINARRDISKVTSKDTYRLFGFYSNLNNSYYEELGISLGYAYKL